MFYLQFLGNVRNPWAPGNVYCNLQREVEKNTAFQRLKSFEFDDYKRKQWLCLSQSCACTEFKFPYF